MTTAVALTACGGSTGSGQHTNATPNGASEIPQSPGASTIAACNAVPQSDAATLTGDEHVASIAAPGATSGLAGGASTCIYADLSNATAGGNGVVVVIEPVPGQVNAQTLQAALMQAEKNGGAGSSFHVESGIGDAAYSKASEHEGDIVFAKGTTLVVIAVTSSTKSGADIVAAVRQVASGIAARI